MIAVATVEHARLDEKDLRGKNLLATAFAACDDLEESSMQDLVVVVEAFAAVAFAAGAEHVVLDLVTSALVHCFETHLCVQMIAPDRCFLACLRSSGSKCHDALHHLVSC